ncbi:MAG: Gfo/Idh/MocA family oxidoreductase [Verrucomicrobiota bacterium]|jgi:predicted dehydrogenase
MRKINWGVLGTAKIGLNKVIPAMQAGKYCSVTAIASRDGEKARVAAGQLGIPKAYGSYEALLVDADVEAVYIPLPNHLHVPWSIQSLAAGKHVLCEKPIGLNVGEARKLLETARQYPRLKIMEAFMYRHHPQWQLARKLVKDGQIGELRSIQSFFSYRNVDPKNIRNIETAGGGGLMDIGCYCISLSRFIFDAEPRRVLGLVGYDPALRIDRLTSGMLEFQNGTSTFTCATQLAPYQRVNIFGTEGRIEIEIPFNAPPDRPCRIWHQRGLTTSELTLEAVDQYTIQADLFALAVLEDGPVPTPLEDALANMRVIEAVFQSARRETWV